MALTIIWSKFAKTQLKEIMNSYSVVAGIAVAHRLVSKIINRVDILYNNPRAGQSEEFLEHYIEGFRYLVEGNYKIIYWINNDEIIISSVFDCRQNPVKMTKLK
jgi:plasmid stabilization system protein ParE